jgi:hypothetical protein
VILGTQKKESVLTEFIIRLTPEEREAFLAGRQVKRISGDSKGRFTVTVKLTRPKTKAERMAGL